MSNKIEGKEDYRFCFNTLNSIFSEIEPVNRTLARFVKFNNGNIEKIDKRIQGLMHRCGNINAVKEFLIYLVFETYQQEENDYSYQMARLGFIEKIYKSPVYMAMKQPEKDKIVKLMKWQVDRVVRMRDLICSKTDKVEDKKILDIGCGIGQLSYQLAKHGMQVNAVDLDVKESIEIQQLLSCEYSFVNNISFSKGNALDLSNIKKKYDIITLADVVEHITNKEQLFTAIDKKLFTGGSLVIHTDNLTKLRLLLIAKRIIYFLTLRNPKTYNLAWSGGEGGHIGLETPKYLINILKKYNYRSTYKYDKDSILSKLYPKLFANGFMLMSVKQ